MQEDLNLEDSDLKRSRNILPEDHKYLTFLKKVFRHEFRKNGFRRLSTPYFLDFDFLKKIFADTISKNVFSFEINWEKKWFKPYSWISNLKAYIDEQRNEELQPVYSYFLDVYYPKNDEELRWIWLFWADVIWIHDVIIDIQNLFIVSNILNKIWLKDSYDIKLNFIWTKKEQEKYKEKLRDFYSDKKHLLTDKWLEYLENDIFKLLSSKDEDEQELALKAPKMNKSYKKDSKKDFEKLKEYLDILEIGYELDENLFWKYDFNDW